MKTKRELAQEQLDLMDDIRAKANINMVTCGHCGTILLHEMKSIHEDNSLTCFSCKREWTDLCDCPDLWYEGCIESSVFDEEETKLPITVRASDFINWYLSDSDDAVQLGYKACHSLINKGKFEINVEELFNGCGYIPASICENVPEGREDEDFNYLELVLINDLT